ncbi:hypothetical protein A5697_03115 [Mycobacterium sp. E3251]|uniref:DUF732 domain-containing protein n=1 Tax=unclassified Mycobacterium TaxID=2642494 RepID=UPI0007FBA488|nr:MULTISPECIES: DUF732 domain-containing protein [unclassified Mycobacterium]OBG93964.1 hypothetical protein A5697_03115 [Mycobacterium sp. E3251]OBI25483.1 hypothetical protein A5711_06275 [Mycobacterium sp. E2238]OBI39402.1 hypothetical protein A5709_11265 [Mycobacterium sp. E1386]
MRVLLLLASFAAAIGAATPAQADPAGNPDASFLAALDQAGVPYKNGAVAIQVGKKACELMDQGHSKAAVIQSVSSENAGFTVSQATSFTTSAVNAYCPQHIGEPNTEPPPRSPDIWMIPWIPFPPPGAA